MKALRYHARRPTGKTQITATKPCDTATDLALVYTPGVATPCRAIQRHPDSVYRYTNKGNLVAIVSNGTAVLGLGNLGPLAAKPVMEGKSLLFKRLADIDAFDLELDVVHPEELVRIVTAIAPTFGGINLEDIKAPECFEVEEALIDALPIPVFHDDQHGTAIVVGAALLNGLDVQGKAIGNVRVVIAGAGAAGIACAAMLSALGIAKEHIVLVDSRAVVYSERTDLNRYKRRFATQSAVRTLADALRGADVFIGVSGPGTVTAEMVCSMTERPLIFALANPDPEVSYNVVEGARPDAIFASGRSDYPNQVNNVLAFPSIFRGALDVRATRIDEKMKLAACRAIAAVARRATSFGRDCIIPMPLDSEVLPCVAAAVAGAAVRTGVASRPLTDLTAYSDSVAARVRLSHEGRAQPAPAAPEARRG